MESPPGACSGVSPVVGVVVETRWLVTIS